MDQLIDIAVEGEQMERPLIGVCLADPKWIDHAIAMDFPAGAINDPYRRDLWETILRFRTAGDIVTIENLLIKGDFKPDHRQKLLYELMESEKSAPNPELYAKAVIDKLLWRWKKGRVVPALVDIQRKISDGVSREEITRDIGSLPDIVADRETHARGITDIAVEAESWAKAQISGVPSGIVEVTTGIPTFDRYATHIQPYEYVIVAARTSHGKAQPYDEPVLLQSGHWKPIGHLQVGDSLCSIDGEDSFVQGIFPQGIKKTYRVTVSGGANTMCCEDHLWEIGSPHWNKGMDRRVVTTKELVKLLERTRYKNRIFIDTISGNFGRDDSLPIDPYLLGALLGDGCITRSTPMISSVDQPILDEIQKIVSKIGCTLTKSGGCDYRISGGMKGRPMGADGIRQINPVTKSLIELQVHGTDCYSKFIPFKYLTASYDTRLALMQGLMDTDGSSMPCGSMFYSSVSERLADGVMFLARSLGCVAGKHVHKNRWYTYKGEKRLGMDCFEISIMHKDREKFFRLGRKKRGKSRRSRCVIKSVVEGQEKLCLCIKVSHPSQLYVTHDFILTHNTSLMEGIAGHNLRRGLRVAYFTIESSDRSVVQQMAAQYAGVNLRFLRDEPYDRSKAYFDALNELKGKPFLIFDRETKLSQIQAKCRMLSSSFKPDVVFIDYLNIISTGDSDAYQRMSNLSEEMIALRKTLGCALIAGAQLNRGNEKENRRPERTDLRDSGSLEEDAHRIIALYRPTKDLEGMEQGLGRAIYDYELLQLKLRDGPVAGCNIKFRSQWTRFYEESKTVQI